MRRLDEITRDAANATNGPWEVREDGHVCFVHGYGTVARDMTEWDAAFIAAARTDVPDLVALVERLRDALETAQWGGEDAKGRSACPVCEGAFLVGHSDNCPVRAAVAAADGTDGARDESANPPACDCVPIKTHVGWTIHQPGCATNKTARDDGQGGT